MIPELSPDIIKPFSNFLKMIIEVSWAFSFFEIKDKLSPSIFHCIILWLSWHVIIFSLFIKHVALIQPELEESIFLIILWELILIIVNLFSPAVNNKSLDIINKLS